jgi:hypothetical protein
MVVRTSISHIQDREDNPLLHLSVLQHQLQQLRVAPPELPHLHAWAPHARINAPFPSTCRQILRPPHHPLHVPTNALVLQPHRPHYQRRRFLLVARHCKRRVWEPGVYVPEKRLARARYGLGPDLEDRRLGPEIRRIGGDEPDGDGLVEERESDVGGESAGRRSVQSDGGADNFDAVVWHDLGRRFLRLRSAIPHRQRFRIRKMRVVEFEAPNNAFDGRKAMNWISVAAKVVRELKGKTHIKRIENDSEIYWKKRELKRRTTRRTDRGWVLLSLSLSLYIYIIIIIIIIIYIRIAWYGREDWRRGFI